MNKPDVVEECEKIMEAMLKKGYKHRISSEDLEAAIIEIRGIDPRTIKRWTHLLFRLEFIHGLPHGYYEYNITKVPKLFQILKEQPQTHLE